jgi:hypothetical protein
MPSNKGNARSPGLSGLLEGLCGAGIEFILVGGLAAVIQGAPVTTMDLDIVHRQTPDNISRLLAFLKTIEACHRRLDDKIIEPTAEQLSAGGHCLLKTRFGPLDVLATIEHGKSYDELLAHTVEIEFRNHTLRVLRLETLIKLKESSNDPKDRQRLPILKETLKQLKP